TIANMSPEYGATVGFFPVDAETIAYLNRTGRDPADVDLVERYCREQRLFRTDETPDPIFSEVVEFNLGDVVPSVAGPKRPQDLVPLTELGRNFATSLPGLMQSSVPPERRAAAEAAYARWTNEGGNGTTATILPT